MSRSPSRLSRCAPLLGLLGILGVTAAPSTAHADPPAGLALEFPAVQYTLDNGLRVVLSPSDRSPTVAIAVYYDVGSRNEVEGRSGFAHLFEHMMFQGSENVPKGEHFRYISGNGGRMNGTTSEDRTNYFEILPSDRLALGLWLEADRMRSLDISTENFENQREVVKEERRLRVDNQPYVPAYLAFQELFYDSFEYGHSVIGSMDDLDAAEVADVQAFFDLYYAPNNAVLTIVGDFDVDEARALVQQHFGDIPRGAEPPPVVIEETPPSEPRLGELVDRLATQPALLMAWHIPPAPHADNAVAEVLARVLSEGQSSRLYSRLVRDDELALEVSAAVDGKRGPDMFYLSAITRGQDPQAVRTVVLEELARLASAGIGADELSAAQASMARDLVFSVEGNLGLALRMGRDALYYGDPQRLNGELGRIYGVTAADVQRVAQTYLTENSSTTMLVRLPASEDGGDGVDGGEGEGTGGAEE